MARYLIGDQIPLTLLLSKNGMPFSGQTATVKVVNASDNSELLAETSLVEIGTSGVYKYLWSGAPLMVVNLIAIYKAKNRNASESIQIVESEFQKGKAGDLSGVLAGSPELTGKLEPSSVIGIVEESDLSGEAENGDAGGSIENQEVSGNLDC